MKSAWKAVSGSFATQEWCKGVWFSKYVPTSKMGLHSMDGYAAKTNGQTPCLGVISCLLYPL